MEIDGQELARRRKEVGLNSTQMAGELGVTLEHLSRVEHGKAPVSARFVSHHEEVIDRLNTIETIMAVAGADREKVQECLAEARGRSNDFIMNLLQSAAVRFLRNGHEENAPHLDMHDIKALEEENDRLRLDLRKIRAENHRLRSGIIVRVERASDPSS